MVLLEPLNPFLLIIRPSQSLCLKFSELGVADNVDPIRPDDPHLCLHAFGWWRERLHLLSCSRRTFGTGVLVLLLFVLGDTDLCGFIHGMCGVEGNATDDFNTSTPTAAVQRHTGKQSDTVRDSMARRPRKFQRIPRGREPAAL
ncbi:hypothetical protein CC79DRAFT_1164621 [Sarocladium strictum]